MRLVIPYHPVSIPNVMIFCYACEACELPDREQSILEEFAGSKTNSSCIPNHFPESGIAQNPLASAMVSPPVWLQIASSTQQAPLVTVVPAMGW